MSDFSERDRQLMALVGLTEEQVLADERMAESEAVPDDLTGRVHYGLHLTEPDEQMVSVSVRMPKSTLDGLTAMARRYHISRSEYMRRKLAGANHVTPAHHREDVR
ncbi:ribbon-helix-helix protein, CopG family, partial [Bifidobacterium longum]|uniref:ribbon-helix-helix protein, CopG family n=1 Tax=Bifidobacterium longum TaxID=216816 RepID=UPI00103F5E78